MPASQPVVLIVAPANPYLSRSLPRLFAKAGARVVFASPTSSSVRLSRYIHEYRVFDSRAPDAIHRLEEKLQVVDPNLLVIVEEPFVQKILDLPAEGAPRARRLLKLHSAHRSRSGFHLWAEAAGIRVPCGRVCRDIGDARSALNDWGSIFLKCDGSSGGAGVRRVNAESELHAIWEELRSTGTIIAQRTLEGAVGVTDMIVKDGKLLAWVSSEKWRTAMENGPSIARRLCKPEGMEELARHVAEKIGGHGLCGFDWVIDHRDGLPRIIEFHPRPPSGFGIGRWAGVSFDRAIAALLDLEEESLQYPDPGAFARKPICCYFPDHPLTSLRRRDWKEFRHWLPGSPSRSWSMLPWDDPKVMCRVLSRALKPLFKRGKAQSPR